MGPRYASEESRAGLTATDPEQRETPDHGGAGTVYGIKTTLYLPTEFKRAIELESRRRRVSEAEVVREALREKLLSAHVRPRGGIIAGREQIAERVDELLAEGFGR